MQKHQHGNNDDTQTPCPDKPGLEGRPNHDTIANGSLLTQGTVDGVAATALDSLRTDASHAGTAGGKGADTSVGATTTKPLGPISEAIGCSISKESLSPDCNPAREFGMFNRLVLEPMTVVAVRCPLELAFPELDGLSRGPSKRPSFVSYKAHLDDVTRPDGAFGRVLAGMHQTMVIYSVSASMIPQALKALPQVELPISAVVCDAVVGLEVWVKSDWESGRSYSDDQYQVMQTMRGAGIEGIIKEPQSLWLIPGSMPTGSSDSNSLRHRLLFACGDPDALGMDASTNEVSDPMY